jgi:hypothetical protein
VKVAIYTQILENYGAHDWDGKGVCPQHWKPKGGEVYVVPNLTAAQISKIKDKGIPNLTALISTNTVGYQEYVADLAFLDDHEAVGEAWDTPYELRWIGGRWVATRTVENGEYGYMSREVASKTEEYDMLPGGERGNYRVVYTMCNGDIVDGKNVSEYLAKAA